MQWNCFLLQMKYIVISFQWINQFLPSMFKLFHVKKVPYNLIYLSSVTHLWLSSDIILRDDHAFYNRSILWKRRPKRKHTDKVSQYHWRLKPFHTADNYAQPYIKSIGPLHLQRISIHRNKSHILWSLNKAYIYASFDKTFPILKSWAESQTVSVDNVWSVVEIASWYLDQHTTPQFILELLTNVEPTMDGDIIEWAFFVSAVC